MSKSGGEGEGAQRFRVSSSHASEARGQVVTWALPEWDLEFMQGKIKKKRPLCQLFPRSRAFKSHRTLAHFPTAASFPRCTDVLLVAPTHSGAEWGKQACLVCRHRQGPSCVSKRSSQPLFCPAISLFEQRAHTPRARARTPPQRAQKTSSCSTASGLPRQRPSPESAWARVKIWGVGFARRQYV